MTTAESHHGALLARRALFTQGYLSLRSNGWRYDFANGGLFTAPGGGEGGELEGYYVLGDDD